MADLEGFISGGLVVEGFQADICNICPADALRDPIALQESQQYVKFYKREGQNSTIFQKAQTWV